MKTSSPRDMVRVSRTLILVCCLSALTFISCNKHPGGELPQPENPHFVSLDAARQLAAALEIGKNSANEPATRSSETLPTHRPVKEIEPVYGADGLAAYYIINYEGGGFLILAANDRVEPVMAWSGVNHFPIHTNDKPGGLVDWMEEAREVLTSLRSNATDLPARSSLWEQTAIQRMISGNLLATRGDDPNTEDNSDPGPCTCEGCQDSYIYTRLTRWTHDWYQFGGFNEYLNTTEVCPQNNFGKPPVGCVGLAVAAIMRYHERPRTFNWSEITWTVVADEPTARYVATVSSGVKTGYSCSGSSATNEDALFYLKTCGYLNAKLDDYNAGTIHKQIKSGLPVYIAGFPNSGSGHAWVCTGTYRQFIHQIDHETGEELTQGHSRYQFYINWMQFDSRANGWFSDIGLIFKDLNSGLQIHYNKKLKMIYDLIPMIG